MSAYRDLWLATYTNYIRSYKSLIPITLPRRLFHGRGPPARSSLARAAPARFRGFRRLNLAGALSPALSARSGNSPSAVAQPLKAVSRPPHSPTSPASAAVDRPLPCSGRHTAHPLRAHAWRCPTANLAGSAKQSDAFSSCVQPAPFLTPLVRAVAVALAGWTTCCAKSRPPRRCWLLRPRGRVAPRYPKPSAVGCKPCFVAPG